MNNIAESFNVDKSWTDIVNTKIGNFSLGSFFSAALVLLVCIFVIKLIMKLIGKIIDRSSINNTISGFMKISIKIVLYFISAMIVADILGIPVTSLVALFSVAGIAVSLSVQNSLSNIAASFTILSTKPFSEGDFIETADVSGTVKEIGLFYTKITTLDNKLVNITNADLAQSKIINYTAEEKRRVDINVTASYDADISEVEKALVRSALSVDKVLDEPAVFATVTGYGNSSISYVVRAWVKTEDYWDAYYAVTKNIKYEFDKAGIEMTYDHINVHMIDK